MADSDNTGSDEVSKRREYEFHGLSYSPEYHAWYGMIRRCYTPHYRQFVNYGGRGITVCDRWKTSFMAFLKDIGRRPSPDHSLDRINNDGNYEPGNCRWATNVEQCNNMRRNVRFTFDGVTKTLRQWSRTTGISSGSLEARIKLGWDVERMLTTPTHRSLTIEMNGVRRTYLEWSRATGFPVNAIRARIRHGWSTVDALTVPCQPRIARASRLCTRPRPKSATAPQRSNT